MTQQVLDPTWLVIPAQEMFHTQHVFTFHLHLPPSMIFLHTLKTQINGTIITHVTMWHSSLSSSVTFHKCIPHSEQKQYLSRHPGREMKRWLEMLICNSQKKEIRGNSQKKEIRGEIEPSNEIFLVCLFQSLPHFFCYSLLLFSNFYIKLNGDLFRMYFKQYRWISGKTKFSLQKVLL